MRWSGSLRPPGSREARNASKKKARKGSMAVGGRRKTLLAGGRQSSITAAQESGISWNVRLGYVVVPCEHANEVGLFYQNLFLLDL